MDDQVAIVGLPGQRAGLVSISGEAIRSPPVDIGPDLPVLQPLLLVD
jgi:hypothetical protein